MDPRDYTKRFYRKWQTPADLVEFKIKYKESDLIIFADKDLSDIALPLLKKCRMPIEKTIEDYPLFKNSLKPIQLNSEYPIIKKMLSVSKLANVGPMAGVAGAIAQCLGESLLRYSKELIIENGGDIFINSRKDRILKVYSGENSPFKDKLKIRLKGRDIPYGVCTSSKSIGHSLNFGNSDATVIISRSAIIADMFATAISNMVKSERDLKHVIEYAQNINDLDGGLIVINSKVAVWGSIEFV